MKAGTVGRFGKENAYEWPIWSDKYADKRTDSNIGRT